MMRTPPRLRARLLALPTWLALLAVLLAACTSEPRAPDPQTPTPTDVIRIACVGDSITEGTANADHATNSWPDILARLLEATHPGRHDVGNFGRSGATLLRAGRKPYVDQDVFAASHAFEPDIVVIALGTNDANPNSWDTAGAQFAADARWLVDGYRALPSRPLVYLGTLTPMLAPHPRLEVDAAARAEIGDSLQDLAAELGLPVIDLTTPLAGRHELLPDGVHPNTAGNEVVAQAVYRELVGDDPPSDPSLRPRPIGGEPHALVADGRAVDVALGPWTQADGHVTGHGTNALLRAGVGLAAGDFHLRARLRMVDQKDSAAAFLLGDHTFGFEGARGTVFRDGPRVGGLRLLHPSDTLWERGAWIDFEVIRNDGMVWFLVDGFVVDMAPLPGPVEPLAFDPMRSSMQLAEWSVVGEVERYRPPHLVARTKHTPWVDLSTRITPTWSEVQEAADEPISEIPGADGERWMRILERGPLPDEVDPDSIPVCLAQRWEDANGRWSAPYELPASLGGKDHVYLHLPDGRLMLTFLDQHPASPTRGDLVAWVGAPDDLVEVREGQFTCRLLAGPITAAPGARSLELGSDGSVRLRWPVQRPAEPDDVLAEPRLAEIAFTLAELDALVPTPGYDIPVVDLEADPSRHVIVDREPGQYLGHPTTVLLEDGCTILAVYPKGHGKGGIVFKRSDDGGLTWSERLPTPESWATSREVPTIHRVVDARDGTKRLILWSGLYPARLAVSEDDGATWSELQPAGDWGGIVVMGFVERLQDGRSLAMFHDDGRFFRDRSTHTNPPTFTLYQTFSADGGLTWSEPEAVWSGRDIQLCEPGAIRSPDGDTLAVLLRENSRTRNSHVIVSRDEGRTWSAPRELPAALTGDRHTGKYAPDGRLFLSFRDTTRESPTQGDWVGWVGTFDDILRGTPGQYRVRIEDNEHGWDSTYPGVEVLPDGTFVVTTYGHWDEGEEPYILCARFTLGELDARLAAGDVLATPADG